jgi:hypothetical protein
LEGSKRVLAVIGMTDRKREEIGYERSVEIIVDILLVK